MEIRAQHYYVVITCVIFIPHLLAKPFSLNEAIAEEVRGKQSSQTTFRSKSADTFEANLNDKPLQSTKHSISEPFKTRENLIPANKKTSSIKYKKTFKITTPLKPKRHQKLRYKLKNKTAKRAIDSNEVFNSKYIPLLKSLGMLLDNFLNPDTSESYEIYRNKSKKNYLHSSDNEPECACKFKPIINKLKSHKTTTTPLTTSTIKIPDEYETVAPTEITTTSTYNTTAGHFRSFKRNKNIPILLTRNTSSRRRDDNGIREGSSTTNYGSVARYISGNYGDNERYTGIAENATIAQYNEEYPNSALRNNTSSNGSSRRILRNGNITRDTKDRRTTEQNNYFATEEAFKKLGRSFDVLKGENKLEGRGYKAESAISIPNIDSGLRRYAIENATYKITKPKVTEQNYEKSNFNVTVDNTSHKRFLDRNGPHTTENQKNRRTDEAITSIVPFETSKPVLKIPVVTIIDGYSIARDVNGQNKLTEKAIHILT